MNYCINVRGMEAISLWHFSGVMEDRLLYSGLQLICIVGSGVSHLPLDNTIDSLRGSGQASLLTNQAQ